MSLDSRLIKAFHPKARIVLLSGAGLSKESGIPTFRDAQEGLWARFDPEELASPRGFEKNPRLVMDWYNWRRDKVLASEPNAAHRAIAQWEAAFPELQVVTQNVDGLHQKAGSEKVIEMHGSIHRMKCHDAAHPSEWIKSAEPARCAICSSLLRPDIVWFGEYIDPQHLRMIEQAIRHCDIFLAIGTSGHVYPAAGFLSAAKGHGALSIVVNPDADAKGEADVLLQGPATEVLVELTRKILPESLRV